MSDSSRLLFASDIHGSDRCFRKFMAAALAPQGPDILVIGGDISGKYLVPIVDLPRGRSTAHFEGKDYVFSAASEVRSFEDAARDRGGYPWRATPAEVDRLRADASFRDHVLLELRLERVREWVTWADRWLKGSSRRVFINGGNDDPWAVDDILRESATLLCPEGKVVPLSPKLEMLTSGVANVTPWHCPRDLPEGEIAARIEALAREVGEFSRCVFNIHCPPYGTLLDRAPKLDKDLRVEAAMFGVEEASVGSTAVREAIERYQPVASLHGHVHEARAFQRIGKTVALNPGSEYAIGRLNIAVLDFEGSELSHYELLVDTD